SFRIAVLDGWLLVITGPMLIDALRHSPNDRLSFTAGITQVSLMSIYGRRHCVACVGSSMI
ncbi:hypothetical protein BD309DRAFT_871388, partial [Dichomitus squalens]